MGQSAHLGICAMQVNPLDCDGAPDLTTPAIVSCNITQVDTTRVLTDGVDLSDPGGIPGKNCVEVRIDPETDYYDLVLTTCSVFDQELDALLGMSETITNAAGAVIGSKELAKRGQFCICECGDEACARRVALTIWHLNMCGGGGEQAQQFHPDGRYWVQVFPMLQFRPTAETITINADLNGRTYTARVYENPNFGAGPGGIIPATQAPYDRCRYSFASDVCPPDTCGCLACEASRPTALALA